MHFSLKLLLFSGFGAPCLIVIPCPLCPSLLPSVLFEAKNFSRWNVCSITNQENVFRSSGFSHFTKYVTFKLFVAWVPTAVVVVSFASQIRKTKRIPSIFGPPKGSWNKPSIILVVLVRYIILKSISQETRQKTCLHFDWSHTWPIWKYIDNYC